MKTHLSYLSLLVSVFLACTSLWAASDSSKDLSQPDGEPPISTSRNAAHVLQIIGLPDTKAHAHGDLSLTSSTLSFSNASSRVEIPRQSIIAASVERDSAELWGRKGQILRIMIPEGGGLAAAAVMHHHISLLTVEFRDAEEAVHEAVFELPSADADHIEHALSVKSSRRPLPSGEPCPGGAAQPDSVLVRVTSQDGVDVPTAYRALLDEQLIDRLKQTKGIGHVYRPGVWLQGEGCPRYTIGVSITGFKQGSQVKRSATGPIGMIVGATKIDLDVTLSDPAGTLEAHHSIRTAVRSQSENMDVAQKAAKKIAKQVAADLKKFQTTGK